MLGLKLNQKKVSQSKKFTADKINFYKEKKYLSDLKESEIKLITQLADKTLMDVLKHELVQLD